VLRFIFPLVLIFVHLGAYSQNLPPITNFTPIDYKAENQNWKLTQSKKKNIYSANNSGLLEFNGAEWKLYGSPNGSSIRSVKAIEDVIYTGCYMEFGFWTKNNIGELEYSSISGGLSLPLLEDEEFWSISSLDNWVLFQSLERIYIYNTSDKSSSVVDSKSTITKMFNLNGTIYYHSIEKGLFKIENGQSILVSDDILIKSSVITGIFSVNDKPLLVTEKGVFYILNNEGLSSWNDPFKNQLDPVSVYSSLQLSDGTIVLGTISNGIYQIDKKGNILREISQKNGLNNNTVLSIFEDMEQNLWLALDNGISVINLNSPFNEYIDKNGELGVVYTSKMFNDYLYLGTNQGLFYKSIKDDNAFQLIKGTEGQVWFLKIIDEELFSGHNRGTFIVNKGKAKLIADFPGTWDVKKIPHQDNLLLQGNYDGLSVLEKSNGIWSLRNVIEGFDISSRFFEFVGDHQLIVNREFKGIFNLHFDSEYREVLEVQNEPSKGTGASLVSYLDEVFYTCNNGIFRYDRSQRQFVTDTLLTDAFYRNGDDPIGIFIADRQKNRLWCFTDKNIAYASPGKFNTKSEVSKIAIPSYVRSNLGVLGFESLTPLGNEKYLIGILNGYLTLDLEKLTVKEYAIRINAISRKSADSEFEKIPIDTTSTFEYSQNNLFFSYHVPEFDKYTEVNYQYQLKGIYNNWSDWSSACNTSFENLPFGNYTFSVKAKVGNNLLMNVASYEFRIKRPWYLSNLAIFFYVLGLFLLAISIHKLYKNYYKKQHERLLRDNKKKLKRKKLKAQKKIIQINNEKLKEEVESKNRELAISTMSIIKKNEFLNAIKDQLRASAENPQIKSVIRTIDRNINNSDDWKFFEDAFNNADKNFLKKIKSLHPELTANDLRLCAYLRLNLSSKEIAPLLNISLRSVEVKRYRLRKKINLPHEKVLTDYIMRV